MRVKKNEDGLSSDLSHFPSSRRFHWVDLLNCAAPFASSSDKLRREAECSLLSLPLLRSVIMCEFKSVAEANKLSH